MVKQGSLEASADVRRYCCTALLLTITSVSAVCGGGGGRRGKRGLRERGLSSSTRW
jgi:hypothetical protein